MERTTIYLGAVLSFNWRRGFFRLCALDEERIESDSKSQIIGNNTMLGQIATFIETLHLSYDDVVYKIPYRNLIIMKKDRLRETTNDVKKDESGVSMAQRRRKNK